MTPNQGSRHPIDSDAGHGASSHRGPRDHGLRDHGVDDLGTGDLGAGARREADGYPQDPAAALDAIAAEIAAARTILARGEAVDLASVEARVNRFCQSLNALPPGSGDGIRPRMLGLIDALTVLEREMRAVFAETRQEMDGFTARQRATAAYGRPDGR